MKERGGVNIEIIGDETYSVAFLNKEDYEKVGKLALNEIWRYKKNNLEEPKEEEEIVIRPKTKDFASILFFGLICRQMYDGKDLFLKEYGFSFVLPCESASKRINEASSR